MKEAAASWGFILWLTLQIQAIQCVVPRLEAQASPGNARNVNSWHHLSITKLKTLG